MASWSYLSGLALDDVHEHAAERAGMGEADQRAARAGTALRVDHRQPGGGHAAEQRVGVARLHREVVQPAPARGDVAGDRALILSRGAGAAVLDVAGLPRIEVGQELQLAVADRDERHATG